MSLARFIGPIMLLCGLCMVIVAVVQGEESRPVEIKYTMNVPDDDVMKLRTNEYKSFYKILTRTEDDKIYIGGREELLIINSNDLTDFSTVSVPKELVQSSGSFSLTCEELVGQANAERLCQNYIRLAENLNSNTILVCGTNSYKQMCKFISVDGKEYTLEKGTIPAERKVQYSVDQNTTALFNQDTGRLFVAHNQGSQLNPAFISYYTVDAETPALVEVGQTNDQNEKYINEPSFVGKPYRYNGFIYFFYRETAVEVVNQGKFIYSRVGRVCENDNTGRLNTFFKARLNCSLQGTFPFYFDYLQDVIVEEDALDPIFYTVFTTTPDGPSSSAICSYKMSDIIRIFETSKFKGKTASGKLPGPIDRPPYANKFTQCDPSTTFKTTEMKFQEDNPLMDMLVPNFNARDQSETSHPPLFFTQMNLYSIAHDEEENIFYVGTEYGTILKAVPKEGGPDWYVYEQQLSDVKYPITGLHFSTDTQSLLVVNDRGVYRVDVASCRALCDHECEMSFSPYCMVSSGRCVSRRHPENSQEIRTVDVRILTFERGATLKSCPSRRVEMTCEVKGSEACGEVNLTWIFGQNETLVSCQGEMGCVGETSTLAPFVQYQEISSHLHYKLIHLSVDVYENHTVGEFICDGGQNRTTSVNIEIDESHGCLTRDTYEAREDRRHLLEMENDALSKCNGTCSSKAILFQTCDQCPGHVVVRDSP